MRDITFADFCAGIGGFRIALDDLGWHCVYSCEIDDRCEDTYKLNFGVGFDDKNIFDIDPSCLPEFDVLCAGFPCQPFSIAGKRLGLGDPRGHVFTQITNIVREARPSVVFLENVVHLIHHGKGKSFAAMKGLLEELGYNVLYQIVDSSFFGVPQRRSRVYILGFRDDHKIPEFRMAEERTPETPFRGFINHGDYSIPISDRWQEYIDLYTGKKTLDKMSFEVPKTRKALERISAKADLDNCILQMRSSGIRAISLDEPMPTFAVSHSGGGAMIPVYTGERRHLNLTEMKRIMGFPDSFRFNVARTHAIKQLANAVCPPVIASIGEDIHKALNHNHTGQLILPLHSI